MSTYREIVYLCLDEIKNISDDSTIQEEHVIFLANKYRAFLLKQKYSDVRKEVPTSNYQSICLSLEKVPAIEGIPCAGYYLKSTDKVPNLILVGNSMVTPIDFYSGNITLVDRERMRYVGHNKYLKNFIYCSQGPDNYLYFKGGNPQYLHLEKVKYTGIFEDAEEAEKLSCDTSSDNCDILDRTFPLEEGLITPMVELIVKELIGVAYKPADQKNDANDNLSDLATYIAGNAKSNLAKKLE